MKKVWIGLLIALDVVFVDQVSKNLILNILSQNNGIIEVNSFFNLVTAWNTGVSFSMFNNLGGAGVYILSAFALSVVGFLFYWLQKEEKKIVQIALGMVIGGAIGNVIDRLLIGAVFDFLDFHYGTYHWPAFNVADSFICLGAVIIVWEGLFCKTNKCVSSSKEE